MIPARENVLLPAFYKSNHWKFYMTLLSQSTQNTNHWDKRLTRWTDVDLLKVCLYQSFGFEQTEHLYLVSFASLKLIDAMSPLVWDSNVYINDWFTLRYVESNRKYQSLFSSQFSGILRQIFILDSELGHASGSFLPKDFPPISERNTKIQIWEDLEKIEARSFISELTILFFICLKKKLAMETALKALKWSKTVDAIQNIGASGWQPLIYLDYVWRERNVIISQPYLLSLVLNARFSWGHFEMSKKASVIHVQSRVKNDVIKNRTAEKILSTRRFLFSYDFKNKIESL